MCHACAPNDTATSSTATIAIVRPARTVQCSSFRSRARRAARPAGLPAMRLTLKPKLPRRTVVHQFGVRADLAVLLVTTVQELVRRQPQQLRERALVSIEHASNDHIRFAVRTAERFWHDLIDDAEFEQIV